MRAPRLSLLSLLLAVLFIYLLPRTNIAEAQDDPRLYVVQPGDTLLSIANQYSVTVQALANYNGIRNTNHIIVGQPLRIPLSNSLVTPSPGSTATPVAYGTRDEMLYTVNPGDSLYAIAAHFKVPIEEIIVRNNLRSTTIYVGQRLIIPEYN